MKELLYDDVEKIHGQFYLVCDGRAIADFHALLEAYEESLGSHRATLRSFRELEQENARLRDALEEIRNRTPANNHEVWPHHHWYLHRASTALEGG